MGHPDERPDLLDGPAEPLAFHVDGPMLDRRMGSTQAAVASTSATSASLVRSSPPSRPLSPLPSNCKRKKATKGWNRLPFSSQS